MTHLETYLEQIKKKHEDDLNRLHFEMIRTKDITFTSKSYTKKFTWFGTLLDATIKDFIVDLTKLKWDVYYRKKGEEYYEFTATCYN